MERFLRAFANDQLQVIEVTETRSPKRKKLIIRGYRLGVLMTMEVFAGQEKFFYNERTE